MHAILLRLYQKALANQLAIVVGSAFSDWKYSIPSFAEEIKKKFGVDFAVNHPLDYFSAWNDFVDAAEKVATRVQIGEFAVDYFADAQPTEWHRQLAAIPISNFIDTTFDRSFVKALNNNGRTPRLQDCPGGMLGSWTQMKPENPTIFFMLPEPNRTPTFFGLHEPIRKSKIDIHLSNAADMLGGRDLLLLEMSPHEADWILNLHSLVLAGEKIIHFTQHFADDIYWSKRGVLVHNEHPGVAIDRLLPHEEGHYGRWDVLSPRRTWMDVMRKKQYDCFISYFSGDRDFVDRLERDLTLRDLFVWLDQREVDIGDSLSEKIQEGLQQSYCFIVVLSPEAIQRPWVLEELRAAYAMRLAGELKILPVLHKECTIPPFLSDYRYGDFRDEQRYEESIALLDRSIKNAVMRARDKK